MGKGRLDNYHSLILKVSIVIAELAIPMERDDIPIINGLLPIAILAMLQITFLFMFKK